MKVCYVEMVGKRMSGSQQSLLNLIDQLSLNYGIEPFITCKKYNELLDIAQEKEITTIVIPAKQCLLRLEENHMKQYLKYPLKRLYNAFQISKAVRFLRDNEIDIVHINTIWDIEIWAQAARRAKIPYVWHIREFLQADHNRVFIDKKYACRQLRKADCLIAISNSIKEYWGAYLNCDISLVYNGLPKEKYFIGRTKFYEKNVINCLMVGRIRESKGQLDAVEAIKILRDQGFTNFRLKIIGFRGTNDYELELIHYIKECELGDFVKLVEYTYDMDEFYRESDVGMICSRAEAFGRVTVEYMMAGLTVVGSNTGGTPELIEDGKTGFLYEYGKPEDLASKLLYISDHRKEAENIAIAGQKSALERFSIERTAFEVNQIYQDVILRTKD